MNNSCRQQSQVVDEDEDNQAVKKQHFLQHNRERSFYVITQKQLTETDCETFAAKYFSKEFPNKLLIKDIYEYRSMINDNSNCGFYLKRGACRFGTTCDRNHPIYLNSPTIIIPDFFQHASLNPRLLEGKDPEFLQRCEVEMLHEYEKFYNDIIEKFSAAGTIMTFKCCRNYVRHLRGNVYIQYSEHEYAVEAVNMYNGYCYNGREIEVELSPVTDWKAAICGGSFDKKLCNHDKQCNFLHVFYNPGNEYPGKQNMFVGSKAKTKPKPGTFQSGGFLTSVLTLNPDLKRRIQSVKDLHQSKQAKLGSLSDTTNKRDNGKRENYFSKSRAQGRQQYKDKEQQHLSVGGEGGINKVGQEGDINQIRQEGDINQIRQGEDITQVKQEDINEVWQEDDIIQVKQEEDINEVSQEDDIIQVNKKEEEEDINPAHQQEPGFYVISRQQLIYIDYESFLVEFPNKTIIKDEQDYKLMATDPNNCKFYLKSGACKFGSRCLRRHLRYENSPTILIPNFFQHPSLDRQLSDGKVSNTECNKLDVVQGEFEFFYNDVIGKLRAAGTVLMFKCCKNVLPHLRGNVYVQYTKHEYAVEAVKMFDSYSYNGRQLKAELSPVTNWSSAICGLLIDENSCKFERVCNFLHVFRNPENEYPGSENLFAYNMVKGDPYAEDTVQFDDDLNITTSSNESEYHNQTDTNGCQNRNNEPRRDTTKNCNGTEIARSRSISQDRHDNKNSLSTTDATCEFYLKCGACRLGSSCPHSHHIYEDASTILLQNFFQHPRLDTWVLPDEAQPEFETFYNDLIGKFRAAGTVVMFKCCKNFLPYLRGNVYVQYAKHEYAVEALKMFGGYCYKGRQVKVELSPVTNWKAAICGSIHGVRSCKFGARSCKYLHVFRNPGDEYPGRAASLQQSSLNRTDVDLGDKVEMRDQFVKYIQDLPDV